VKRKMTQTRLPFEPDGQAETATPPVHGGVPPLPAPLEGGKVGLAQPISGEARITRRRAAMKIGFVYPHSVISVAPQVHLFDAITIVTYELARRLSRDHQVVVYSRRTSGASHEDTFDGVELRRLSLGLDKALSSLKFLKRVSLTEANNPFRVSNLYYRFYAQRVATDIARRQLDIVHVHSLETFIPIIRRHAPGSSIVLHCHDHALVDYFSEKTRGRIAQADLILGCSDYLIKNIKRLYPEVAARCHTLHNGIDDKTFVPAESHPERQVVMFAGRISPEKGVHVLLEAFARLASSDPDVHLELVGPLHVAPKLFVDPFGVDPVFAGLEGYFKHPQGYLKSLEERAREVGRVDFAGAVANDALPQRYAAASVFAFPSLWHEPFGIPVIEAMAAGLPVVASRGGAFPEIVEDGVTGFLVDRGDVDGLAAALGRLLADPALRARMGAAGRSRVEKHFTWDRQAERLLDLYGESLCRRGKAKV
jgi:glycosyltransferase involved in cell wall biosynthesis